MPFQVFDADMEPPQDKSVQFVEIEDADTNSIGNTYEPKFQDRVAEIVHQSVSSQRAYLDHLERTLRSQLLTLGHECGLIDSLHDLEITFSADSISPTTAMATSSSVRMGILSNRHGSSQSLPSSTARRTDSGNGGNGEELTTEELAVVSTHPRLLQQPTVGSRMGGFKLFEEWEYTGEEVEHFDEAAMRHMQYMQGLTQWLNRGTNGSTLEARPNLTSPISFFMVRPTARFKIIWDLLAAFLLIYDVLLMPMATFNIPRAGFILAMSLVITFYWTADIITHFFVGYHLSDGEYELSFKKVSKKYVSTWFLPDVVIVTLDYLTYVVPLVSGGDGLAPVESLGIVRLGKLARFVRLLRVLRLARLAKLQSALHYIQTFIGLESTAIMFSLGQNVLLILICNHIIACAWFWVGLLHEDEGWLVEVKVPDERWYQNYLKSLHWSIANFTPGSSGIQPKTTEELLFSVVVLFFALVCFSVFVSSTTSLINRLVGLSSGKTQQMLILKSFLLQHRFDSDLRERVLRYVSNALGNKKALFHRGDVQLLTLLSQPLREEVQLNLHLATLRVHSFFKVLSYCSPLLMRKISVEALYEVSFSRGDVIFSVGQETDKMGFIVSGVLRYAAMMEEKHEVQTSELVGPGECFCESILWTKWHCRGSMQADVDCDLLEIVGSNFRNCLKRHHLLTGLVLRYAHAFIEVLNGAACGTFKHPLTDLQGCYVMDGQPILQVLQETDISKTAVATRERETFKTGGGNFFKF